MATIPQSRLEQVIERFDEVEARMGATTDSDEIVALSREHAELKPVVEAARDLIAMREGLEEAEAMAKGDDAEMAELAQEEINELKAKIPDAESEMQLLLLPKDADDKANIVLEVRAGTGGNGHLLLSLLVERLLLRSHTHSHRGSDGAGRGSRAGERKL